ncbi:MAG: CapA family protein, partial [Bacilli bacterium]|nr:CapA family protein [Bacilli bacterium]MDD4282310.1 CapA family protein [Bacilli bacterium]
MKKTIIILIIMFLVVGCFSKEVVNKNKVKEDKKEYKLSMIMAGDALIHDAVYKDAYVSENKYDFNYMFEDIKPIIQNYDLAFYNQETIIGGIDLELSTYPRFNSPEEIGEALINTGFNLVSLA